MKNTSVLPPSAKLRLSYFFLEYIIERFGIDKLTRATVDWEKAGIGEYVKAHDAAQPNPILIANFLNKMHSVAVRYAHRHVSHVSFGFGNLKILGSIAHAALIIQVANNDLTDIDSLTEACEAFCETELARSSLNGERKHIKEYAAALLDDVFAPAGSRLLAFDTSQKERPLKAA